MRLALASLMSLSLLASCQTVTDIDTAVQKNLPQACAALTVLYASFEALEPTMSAKTQAKGEAAFLGVQTICADPSNATGASVLVSVAAAYAAVSLALKEAKHS